MSWGAILAQKKNSFICKKKCDFLRPLEHLGVQTATVLLHHKDIKLTIFNIKQWLTGSLGQTTQASDDPSIILFFIISHRLGSLKTLYLYFIIETIFAKHFARNYEKKIILEASDTARAHLQPHYGNGIFGNVYLSAGQH